MARVEPGAVMLSGTVGNLVFVQRGEGSYVRQHVVPRDPKTLAQRQARDSFARAVAAWKELSDEEQRRWAERARRRKRTGYHFFVSEFLRAAAEGRESADS